MLNKLPIMRALRRDQWVRPYLRRYRWSLALAIFLGILTFLCGGGLMFCAGYLISRAATHPENILLIYVPIVLTRAFGIARPAVRYAERLVSHNWVFRMTSHLRKKLYDALEKDAVFFNSKYQLGDILGLLSDDISHIQNLYLRTLFPMFVGWGLYVLLVIAFGILSPLMGLWLFFAFALVILAIPVWSIVINGARQTYKKELQDQLYVNLTDNVLGVTDWILAGRGQEYLSLHLNNQKKLSLIQQKMNRFDHWRDVCQQLFFLLIIVSIIIWAGQRFGGHYSMATNWIAAFALALFPMNEAWASLPSAAEDSNIYQESLTRLNHLQPAANRTVKQIKISKPYNLRLKNVHFAYAHTKREVLRGVNLQIQDGEKIAILGPSGAGKSTLASLLRGDLQPSQGSVLLNGQATSNLDDQASGYFSVINQKPYLFNTSIANNLRLGDENASDQQLWQILARVGLKDMVSRLPHQLDTPVEEAGLRFSGGERHRLALARVLLKNTPIVLLDEPTVGLDPVTEQAVITTFLHNLQGKTLIWITHHLQGVAAMDQVIFLEKGQIAMQGSPQELYRTEERYRHLLAADLGQ